MTNVAYFCTNIKTKQNKTKNDFVSQKEWTKEPTKNCHQLFRDGK